MISFCFLLVWIGSVCSATLACLYIEECLVKLCVFSFPVCCSHVLQFVDLLLDVVHFLFFLRWVHLACSGCDLAALLHLLLVAHFLKKVTHFTIVEAS